MTLFMIGRDTRVPEHEGEVVAHAWVVTDAPQPDGYPEGRQLFVEGAWWWSPNPSLRVSPAEAREKAIARLSATLAAYERQYASLGYTFAWPEAAQVLQIGEVAMSAPVPRPPTA